MVPELAKRGVKVRGLVRKSGESDGALANGASEIAIGDLSNQQSMKSAFEGVESVFYMAPAFIPNEAEVGKANVRAAREAGVRRFVFSSVIHPILSELSNHAAKAPVEEELLDSGMEYTFLHPAMFFQNFAASWPKVVETGVHAEPWSTETRFSHVDFRDVTEVAAIALTEDRLRFGTFELCAAGHANRHDVAALMSEVLGKNIRAEKADANKAARGGASDESEASKLKAMFDWYDHHGLLGKSLILSAILGREPRTLRAYFQELAQESAGDSK